MAQIPRTHRTPPSAAPSRRRPRTRAVLSVLALGASLVVAPLTFAPAAGAATPVSDPAALVDPIIGTSGAVDDFPGADVPFGMVQWSPDTPSRPAGGGYEYNDNAITGFSLTHISGPGCGAAGDVPILPVSGAVPANPDAATLPLDHSAETAKAGEYSIKANGITTDLTTTTRSGMGRFTFPSGQPANLLLKLSDSQAGTDATHFQQVNNHEIKGWVTSGHFCGADDIYTMYFDMQFDSPITATGTWQNGSSQTGSTSMTVHGSYQPKSRTTEPKSSNGVRRIAPTEHGTSRKSSAAARPNSTPPVTDASGAYVSFEPTSNEVQAKVGISYVSTANARLNRTKENPGWNFANVAAAAHNAWNKQLRKITISGGTSAEQKTFYTALYHALLHPNVYSDVNREYMGFDGEVHRTPAGHAEYANFSGWDIYRSQAQLEAMVAPEQASDEVRSMLDEYAQTGQLPKWELYNGESYVMVGDPADSIIADAYAFGARDFNHAKALNAMLTEANQPNNVRPGLSTLLAEGYLPLDGTYGCCNFYGPVSTQQEYNVADNSIAQFASALGKKNTAATFSARANSWQNVFNPGSGFLEPRMTNGQFEPNFAPGSSMGFVEGNSYQYTPMEPQDIAGAIAADGGKAAWIAKLDGLTAKVKNIDSDNADFGNEPSIEIPWEYDYAGAPYKTQAVVRKIQDQIFTTQPAGIAGNDDLGTMSAWYVFSALGFYPETPGSADVVLGSALFPKAKITLPSGRTLTIVGKGAADNAPYVQSAQLNGTSLTRPWLKSSLFSKGGSVKFTLGSTPNTEWGSGAKQAPPSNRAGLDPALGYSDVSNVVVASGDQVTMRLGARALQAGKQRITWTADNSNSSAPTVSPSSGSFTIKPGKDGHQTLSITAPSSDGRYTVSIAMRGANGESLPAVVVEVDVAEPGELWPYYSNAGISNDGASNEGNFDGDGWSYSSQQLSAAGVNPGQTVTADGIDYTFPDTQPGDLDNIVAGGQTIPLAAPTSGSRLGLLGSATNASGGAQGNFVVHYSDGTSQTVSLGLSDWTLGAGATGPQYGNVIAATTPYRDTTDGGKQVITTYLFGASTSIDPSKQVVSITFPTTVSSGELHVFAFTVQ